MKTFVPPHVILEKVLKDFLHPLKGHLGWDILLKGHLGWDILIQVINTGGE
jgi:hypothetical protein